MSTSDKGTLGFGLLTALVVGSIIGSGIFGLPQNMAAGAGAGAILIGWLITGLGMLSLALVYQMIALRKPDLNNGVYAYARAISGDYVGFNAAWGYWVSAWISNVSFVPPQTRVALPATNLKFQAVPVEGLFVVAPMHLCGVVRYAMRAVQQPTTGLGGCHLGMEKSAGPGQHRYSHQPFCKFRHTCPAKRLTRVHLPLGHPIPMHLTRAGCVQIEPAGTAQARRHRCPAA